MILLLVLNIFHTYFFSGFFVDFEQVNVSWEESQKKKKFKANDKVRFYQIKCCLPTCSVLVLTLS